MKIELELNEAELKEIIINYFAEKLGDMALKEDFLKIQVKSKQNYKSEWEQAAFKATYSHYQS